MSIKDIEPKIIDGAREFLSRMKALEAQYQQAVDAYADKLNDLIKRDGEALRHEENLKKLEESLTKKDCNIKSRDESLTQLEIEFKNREAILEKEEVRMNKRHQAMMDETASLKQREQEVKKKEAFLEMEERRLTLFDKSLKLISNDKEIQKRLKEIT